MATSWLKAAFRSLSRRGRRRRQSSPFSLEPLFRRPALEVLEQRIAPVVSAHFSAASGALAVSSNAAGAIALEITGGTVQVNNLDPIGGPVAAGLVKTLTITAGAGANTIDLSRLVSGALPSLQTASVSGGGGLDTLIAPNQANTWTISGANQGNVGGIAFSSVENLTGGNSSDTFNLTSSTSVVTGTITELAGGNVTLSGSAIVLPGTIITQGGNLTINDTSTLGSGNSVTFKGQVYTQGGSLTIFADTIALATQSGPVTLSTRDLASVPGNPATGASVGDSGDIAFNGTTITLGSATGSKGNAGLFSQVETGSAFKAGAIDFKVSQAASGLDVPVLPVVSANAAGITVNAGNVMGGDVTFEAEASSERADDGLLASTPYALHTEIAFLENFTLLGGVAVASSSATINLGAKSSIVASSFTATAKANSVADVEPIALKLGIAIAVANTTASVNAAGQITTTGDTFLQSNAINTLIAIASTGGNLAGAGAGIAVNVENSTSTANVASTAELNVGGGLTVQANTANNRTTQALTTTGDDGKVGVSVGISYANDTTTAQLGGSATVGGDTLIQATEVKAGVPGSKFFGVFPTIFAGVVAAAGVGTDDTGDLLINLQGAATTKVIGLVQQLVAKESSSQQQAGQQTQGQAPAFQAAASVAIDMEVNTATASVAPGATLEDAGNVVVDANINDRPVVLASSGVAQPKSTTKSSGASSTKFDGSVAIALGFYTNTATATIAAGARVDAGANLSVTSEALNDYQLAYGLNLYAAATQKPTHTTDEQGANDVTILPNDIVEVETNHTGGGVVGHWYQYTPTVPLANVDLTTEDFTNTTLWTDLGPGWLYKANNVVSTFTTYLDASFGADNNLVDTWSQATATNASSKIAVAGSLTLLTLNQNSNASIATGAQINQNTASTYRTGAQNVVVMATGTNSSTDLGGSVQVPGIGGSSTELDINVNKPGTGTQASQGAVGAAFVVVLYNDNVTASIATGVKLYADSLNVDAETAVGHIAALISGADSGNFGFNGVFSVVNVSDTTLAHIDAGANITVGTGSVVETFPASTTPVPALTTSAIEADAIPGTITTDSSGNTINTLNASTVVQAHDSLDLFSLTGGIMTAGNAGVGAAVSLDLVKRDTEAYIGDNSATPDKASTSTLVSGGNVIVDAKNTGTVGTLTLAAAKVSSNAAGNGASGGGSQAQTAPPGRRKLRHRRLGRRVI